MDLQSSDDEYFDTYSNFVQQPESLVQNAGDIRETTLIQTQDYIASVPNSYDSDLNCLKIGDSSDINDNSKCIYEQSDDTHEVTVIKNENSDICAHINDIKLDMNDSSDSESLLDELLKSDNNDKCESNEGNTDNKIDNADDHNLEKSNEEIELEERLKHESLLTDEDLNKLRDNSLEMKNDGNSSFQAQSYDEAIKLYTNAIATCPLQFKNDHAIFHSNRGSALSKLNKNEDAIKDLSTALELKPDYLKALLKRAELHEKSDKLKEALDDYRLVLQIDPRNWAALNAEQVIFLKLYLFIPIIFVKLLFIFFKLNQHQWNIHLNKSQYFGNTKSNKLQNKIFNLL